MSPFGQGRFASVANMRDFDVAKAYITNLKAEIQVEVRSNPCRRKEWYKILNGDPVEIPPSYGNGYRVMTINEWARDWKTNPDFKECAACGSINTKEHHFVQVRRKIKERDICIHIYRHVYVYIVLQYM